MNIKAEMFPNAAWVLLFLTLFGELWRSAVATETAELVNKTQKEVPYRIQMGRINPDCDDAKRNLQVDYDGNALEYTCTFKDYTKFSQGWAPKRSKLSCDQVKRHYHPRHYCLYHKITYNTYLPTYEGHRPLWPKYGEYWYVPPQRWLHNIEHGAVVMLYHPCAPYSQVERLKALVTSCIRKHIITPYKLLHPSRPFALVAWGCRLEMGSVVSSKVIDFIKNYALKGPEGTLYYDGQYDFMLKKNAEIPKGSTIEDSRLCAQVDKSLTAKWLE